jgi:precorrin-6B methylase 2
MDFCRRFFALVLTFGVLSGCAGWVQKDDGSKPVLRQSGKDVMWLPTSQNLVNKMLAAAQVTANDIVYDLGAGDGVIAITAAQQFKARAVGIEYDAKLAEFAQKNAQRAGVADKVKIIRGDIFVEDFSEATVVTMYLLPELNMQLRPTLLKMKPGTRIVANAFDMQEWAPDQILNVAEEQGFLWVVPAQVEGEWMFPPYEGHAPATLSLRQSFQQVGGTLTIAGVSQPLLGVRLRGDQLSFHFLGRDKIAQSVEAKVTADALIGHHTSYGQRNPFRAKPR